jgi:tRNA 2-thiouridine synthesizing protein E|tara:strand:- start:1181 stop:1492 length:312 start_codon:yes stop_codon:yes gene_type:complete
MTFAIDKEGFLEDLQTWSPDVAETIASQDNIELTAEHWEIINKVRDYYDEYKVSPAARIIVKLLKDHYGPDTGSSIYLMKLFTGRPARMVNKIAGLPKPTNCD